MKIISAPFRWGGQLIARKSTLLRHLEALERQVLATMEREQAT
jgi:hypothetical protein